MIIKTHYKFTFDITQIVVIHTQIHSQTFIFI